MERSGEHVNGVLILSSSFYSLSKMVDGRGKVVPTLTRGIDFVRLPCQILPAKAAIDEWVLVGVVSAVVDGKCCYSYSSLFVLIVRTYRLIWEVNK